MRAKDYDMGSAARAKEILPLFPMSHRADPMTSYEAADEAVKSGTVQHWHDRILGVLRRYDATDGQTSKEIAYLLAAGQDWQAVYFKVSKRMKELRAENKIYAVGERWSKVGGGDLTAYRIR